MKNFRKFPIVYENVVFVCGKGRGKKRRKDMF